ncbi:MAG: WG repeat-containing protein [Candidatus Paceibacterota bacterium]|jgi:hypothetical protein
MPMSTQEARRKFRYDFIGPFVEGLACVKKGNEWFHVRLDDHMPAYDQRFDDVGNFHNGIATVKKDGREFQIRPDGTRVG